MISRDDITAALRLRARHPIGARHINRDEKDYIAACLARADDTALIVLPTGVLERENSVWRETRAILFSTYHPTHVIDIGRIWAPATQIAFTLFILTKLAPQDTRFAVFENIASLNVPKHFQGPLDGSEVVFGDEFGKLVEWLRGKHDLGFIRRYDDVETDRLTVRYHDPDLQDEDHLLSKPSLALAELCEVISPRKTGQAGNIYRLRKRDEQRTTAEVAAGDQTNVELRPGDILVNLNHSLRMTLIDHPEPDTTPSNFLLVVRCKNDLISPEYLITYLHSDFAWSFAERHKSGGVIERISKRDFLSLPILLPERETLSRSRAVYEVLFCDPTEKDDFFARVRTAIFEPEKVAQNGLQAAYLYEIHRLISDTKLKHLHRIVQNDIQETEACRKAGALKACVVLCGSILEAILLEWLSEIKCTDYIQKEFTPGLNKIIEELSALGVLIDPHKKNSHSIREKRNVIHPSRMLKCASLSENEVDEVIIMLKEVVAKRFSAE